ncbi:MAG TPA: transcriptional repressor LexA [Ruminococcaceae bacterium]|nr:transcriptional repressor LexA [Oscillospiraceae bacterium]
MDEKLLAIYNFISERISQGVPPSVREICAKFKIKSTSTVHKYLVELESRGLIERDNGLNRSIRLVGDTTVKVPLMGVVTAGGPILAMEEITEYIPFKTQKYKPSDLFALKVRGESMINAGIYNGDIIIARKTPVAYNGEIIVALIGEEATVKRFYKENGVYRLQPENDTMAPIIVPSVTVLGKVISLVRYYE